MTVLVDQVHHCGPHTLHWRHSHEISVEWILFICWCFIWLHQQVTLLKDSVKYQVREMRLWHWMHYLHLIFSIQKHFCFHTVLQCFILVIFFKLVETAQFTALWPPIVKMNNIPMTLILSVLITNRREMWILQTSHYYCHSKIWSDVKDVWFAACTTLCKPQHLRPLQCLSSSVMFTSYYVYMDTDALWWKISKSLLCSYEDVYSGAVSTYSEGVFLNVSCLLWAGLLQTTVL